MRNDEADTILRVQLQEGSVGLFMSVRRGTAEVKRGASGRGAVYNCRRGLIEWGCLGVLGGGLGR